MEQSKFVYYLDIDIDLTVVVWDPRCGGLSEGHNSR